MINFKFDGIWIHQIMFGCILYLCNINIDDLSSENLPLFYTTGDCVKLCYENSLINIEDVKNANINNNFECPIFIPREFFHPYFSECNISNLKKFIKNFDNFVNRYNNINLQLKKVTNLP